MEESRIENNDAEAVPQLSDAEAEAELAKANQKSTMWWMIIVEFILALLWGC